MTEVLEEGDVLLLFFLLGVLIAGYSVFLVVEVLHFLHLLVTLLVHIRTVSFWLVAVVLFSH